jgi:ribosomal protein S12 methylthiotransferase
MNKFLSVALATFGCPKNLVDSEKIITRLLNLGYKVTDDYTKADLVVINTCGFINDAILESLENINAALQENGKVIVTGCLGAKQEIILKNCPEVLEITGPNETEKLIQLVQKHLPLTKKPKIRTNALLSQNIKLTPKHYAYLKISEGCNHACSYCIIPDLRGKLKSRALKEIIAEAKMLIANGAKELIIVSQDTAAYGTDLKTSNFQELIFALSELKAWIRLHYLYPYPHIDKVLPLMAKEKIVPYLDVPLQHANSRILCLMSRPANDENMLQRIKSWREICPDLTIRSTFIVGFPGETEKEFQDLLSFISKVKFDRVGCFKYSDVDGAKANSFPNKISEDIKEKRFHEFMSLQQKISIEKLKRKIGKIIKVIVDDFDDDGCIIGRSFADSPDIDGLVFVRNTENKKIIQGDIIDVQIENSDEYDLYGKILFA